MNKLGESITCLPFFRLTHYNICNLEQNVKDQYCNYTNFVLEISCLDLLSLVLLSNAEVFAVLKLKLTCCK